MPRLTSIAALDDHAVIERSSDDATHETRPATPIKATPYTFIDPAAIEPRQFLYGRRLARQFVSGTVAAGGLGKTALVIAEALAMVSAKALLGIPVGRTPLRVWLWSHAAPARLSPGSAARQA